MADTPRMTGVLTEALGKYAAAKTGQMVTSTSDKLIEAVTPKPPKTASESSSQEDQQDEQGDDKKGFVGGAMEKVAEGASPVKAALSGVGTSIKEGVKGLFSRKGGSKRPHNIVEDVFIGVPPDVCFEAFTTWEEFPSFMKGPTSVTRGDEKPEDELEEGQHPLEGEQTNWKGKVFLSTREQKSTTIDYDPPHRVSWKSEGAKGTVDGTVTFTPLGDNATLMLVVLEYRSKGIVEWTANRWRAAGRRMRLDLKHFRRYVMRTEPDDLPEPEEPEEEEQEPTEEPPEGAEDTEGTETEEPTDETDSETPTEDDGSGTDETPDETTEEPAEEPVEDEESEPEPVARKTTARRAPRTASRRAAR